MTNLIAPDPFDTLSDECAARSGVLLVPARPGTRGASVVFNDILGALGKSAGASKAFTQHSVLGELAAVWLTAEQVHTVVLYTAERVRRRALDDAADELLTSGIKLVAVPRGGTLPTVENHSGGAQPASPAGLAHLRRALQPYFAAAALLESITGSCDDLESISIVDVDPDSQTVAVRGSKVAIPAGAWRFVEAQRLHSQRHDRREFFTCFGRPLDRSQIFYGAFKAASL